MFLAGPLRSAEAAHKIDIGLPGMRVDFGEFGIVEIALRERANAILDLRDAGRPISALVTRPPRSTQAIAICASVWPRLAGNGIQRANIVEHSFR